MLTNNGGAFAAAVATVDATLRELGRGADCLHTPLGLIRGRWARLRRGATQFSTDAILGDCGVIVAAFGAALIFDRCGSLAAREGTFSIFFACMEI